MKRVVAIVALLVVIVCLLFCFKEEEKSYLRIHIRANSNTQADQDIKYKIKDDVINYLTPLVSKCDSFEGVIKCLDENLLNIECIVDEILAQNNFAYRCDAVLCNEYFPTRTYENFTLDSGYYDALIIKLGTGEGDNWWCVVYPPLCFVDTSSGNTKYKSRIAEVINSFFS